MDLISIITLLGIAQGFFLGFYFIVQKMRNQRANKIVGFMFISFSVSITHFYFLRTGLYYQFPHFMGISNTMLYLFGPLFYFYVKLLIDRNYKFRRKDALHFIPFVLCCIYIIPFLAKSGQEKLRYLNHGMYAERIYDYFIAVSQIILLFIYLYMIRRMLKRHNIRLRNNASSVEKIDLAWINKGIFCFLATFGVMTVLIIFQIMGYNTERIFHVIIPVMVTTVIFSMGFLGLRQQEIPVLEGTVEEEEEEEIQPVRTKYEKSTLTPEKADEYLENLKCIMEKEKPFLDPELTLQSLSEMLSVQPHHLSQVMNEKLNMSFFDFVNSYRVNEAKHLLISPDKSHLTVLAIAGEAGFNSKSAFNTAFKKFTGLTPTEFKRQTNAAA